MADFERTEKATPKRRSEARKKGQVAKSRDVTSVMVLLSGLLALFLLGSYYYGHFSTLMIKSFGQIGTIMVTPENIQVLQNQWLVSVGLILAPFLGVVVVVSLVSNYVQVGGFWSWELIKPDPEKVFSLQGLRRIFSLQSLMELLKSIGKILIVGGMAYYTIKKELPNILPLMEEEVGSISRYIFSVSRDIFLNTVLVMVLLAGLDYIFQRWSYEKGLRMSKQEIKDEGKQAEGDPLVKARMRSIQRDIARRRMMAEVPKADVIITNPTHIAVALLYISGEMDAPKVVAKGAGFVAEKIKAVGQEHEIPILENKPLAQILYKTVEVGQMIPATLYHLVADVLAFVYRVKKKTL
jgi:flagellar biosynthetic protein FlhB